MPFLPATSSLALKEWAVAVNSMLSGELIVVLRKGGIHKDDKEFRIVHPEFLLFPTYEHQKEELLRYEYLPALQQSRAEDDVPGLVSINAWTEVTDIFGFRYEDFRLDGYEADAAIRAPIAV